ncbi:signal transduction histidine kinase [Murinocardiopsis flavida]|uniref:histidine kinase n=1 Tax=Murinocardiopsis flavida TaxID=645275 RepID=A0A2P8DH62_9ACTN|nr:signal transduction histidine kinase [Murinocardiopsis flavida]
MLGDAVAAVVYLAVLAGQVLARVGDGASGLPLWADLVVVAGMSVPVALRRYRPVPVFWGVLALSVAAALLGVVREPMVGAALTLYTMAAADARRSWVPAWIVGSLSAAAAVLLVLSGPSRGPGIEADMSVGVGVLLLAFSWSLGRGTRDRRLATERFARQHAEQAVAEERLRIAREMHDVVAHSLGLITVKAGVANHVAQARPEEGRDALRVIESTGREALIELRRVLDVLRSPAEGSEAEAAPAPPAPDLAGLPALAERAALTGVRVDLEVDVPVRLPEGVALTVYRIVQEALTNVARHAAPARASVLVAADSGDVRVEIADDGPGARTLPDVRGTGAGHGLIGMAERVAMHHGTFTAGPRPGRGFRVAVVLPGAGGTPVPPAGADVRTQQVGGAETAGAETGGAEAAGGEPGGEDGRRSSGHGRRAEPGSRGGGRGGRGGASG